MIKTNNLKITGITPIIAPADLRQVFPLSAAHAEFVNKSRQCLKEILHRRDGRLMVVVGPCSIHDTDAAVDYARRLAALARRVDDQLMLVMRVYFEKPRTTVGWKGLINDPDMNGSHLISKGLGIARGLLLRITELEVAVIPDGLDPADFVSAKGPDALREVVSAAVPLLRFAIDRRLERWDLDLPEERARALKDSAAVLAPVKDSLLADDYAAHIAGRLFADLATVKRAILDARAATEATGRGGESEAQVPAGVVTADSMQVRTERDLLDLLVRTPRLRSRARFLLSEHLLTDRMCQKIAEGIADADPAVDPEVLVGRLEGENPGAAGLLSGATLGDVPDADADVVEHDLERRLKEFDLERRIAAGRERLRRPESFKDAGEYDDLFKNVSALQVELERYRRGARDGG